MRFATGSRLGPYEIVSPLGAGGMGEVYRARDTRLDRTVAIKVMPAHAIDDPDARSRFEREARAISSLNHPNICTLYDVGSYDGSAFLVMEYVDGQTLADRLTKGPLAPDETLRYGVEICEALDKAHRLGIVHRDLKPANIMLTRSGIKLLDFGLAKLIAPTGAIAEAPTRSDSPTARGTILGTMPYMAPEQLEGKEADARTDIFAFGTVVYEMATGKRAFVGDSQASLISAIMSSEPPPLTSVQPLAPPALDRIVRKCLKKDPDERWQTSRDLADELKWISTNDPVVVRPGVGVLRRTAEWWAWGMATIFALAALALGVLLMRQPPAAPRQAAWFALPLPTPTSTRGAEIRSEITTSLAVSPDGRYLALAVVSDGRSRLWLRSLGEAVFKALPGTEGAFSPFWSPDSRFIGFGAEGKLKKVEVSGGSPRVICDAAFEGVPTWNQFGTILFADDLVSLRGIMSVSADGGTPVPVTTVDPSKGTLGHNWPHFLPDGQHFLFTAMLVRDIKMGKLAQSIFMGSLDGAEPKAVATIQSRVEYTGSGHLLYVNDGTLSRRESISRVLDY